MTKRFAIAWVLAAVVAGSSFLSPAPASAAPGVVGQTYAEAAAAIAQQGGTVIVASRIGDRLPLNECIVINVSRPTFVRFPAAQALPGQAGRFRRPALRYRVITDEYRLTLNCNAAVASAKTPGNSASSTAGRAAKRAQEAPRR